jgi:glycosyltransferase involved in cell wall biosynthesis
MKSPKSQPQVSIIIPTFNREKLLEQCLENLVHQTYKDFEVCIVNDGGRSSTHLANQFRQSLEIQLFEFPSNQGQVKSRNEALHFARGEFISLCDDDDELLPAHLDELVKGIGHHDLAYAAVEIWAEDPTDTRLHERLLFAFDFDAQLLRRTNFIIPSSTIYRKSLHQILGIFDEAANNYWDWDWFLRVAKAGNIVHVPRVTVRYHYNLNGSNLSINPEKYSHELDYLSKKHGLGKLPSSNFYLMAKYGLPK